MLKNKIKQAKLAEEGSSPSDAMDAQDGEAEDPQNVLIESEAISLGKRTRSFDDSSSKDVCGTEGNQDPQEWRKSQKQAKLDDTVVSAAETGAVSENQSSNSDVHDGGELTNTSKHQSLNDNGSSHNPYMGTEMDRNRDSTVVVNSVNTPEPTSGVADQTLHSSPKTVNAGSVTSGPANTGTANSAPSMTSHGGKSVYKAPDTYEGRSGTKPSKRDQNWDMQYEALLAYANKYKHCNIRPGYTVGIEDKPQVNLYAWLALQRRHKKQGKLRPDREVKLQELVNAGLMTWSGSDMPDHGYEDDEYIHVLPPPPPPSWNSHFDELLVYAESTGHGNVPPGHLVTLEDRKNIDLGQWVDEQRRAWSRRLPESPPDHNLSKLNTLHMEGRFSWELSSRQSPARTVSQDILDKKWSVRFEALRDFVSREGNEQVCLGDRIEASLDVPVPGEGRVESFHLGLWVRAQRMCHLAEALPEERKEKLQKLVDAGVLRWMSEEEAVRRAAEAEKRAKEEEALWTAWYNALLWHGTHKGHCNLRSHDTITLPDGSEAELGKWLHIQRAYIKKGRLRLDRVKKIKKLFDQGKMDPVRWAHVFTLKYPVEAFAPLSDASQMGSAPVTSSSLQSTAEVESRHVEVQQQKQVERETSESNRQIATTDRDAEVPSTEQESSSSRELPHYNTVA